MGIKKQNWEYYGGLTLTQFVFAGYSQGPWCIALAARLM